MGHDNPCRSNLIERNAGKERVRIIEDKVAAASERFQASPVSPLRTGPETLSHTDTLAQRESVPLGTRSRVSVSADLLRFLLLGLAVVFFVLHYLHLAADFPNHSPWMDWAKYTDEGWYGDAAIRHALLGHWYVKGDFNPAAALPVWPALEAGVFHFTGVGAVPARALTVTVFGFTLFCAYALLKRSLRHESGPGLAPAGAVLLLAASPFCYAFMRMAILEPLLILLTLVALLAASAIDVERPGGRLAPALAVGFLLPLLVLTKTTALFLFPAIAWMMLARCRFRLRPTLETGGLAATVGLVLWLGYFGLVVRPHFLEDYRYLFSANAYTGITLSTAREVLKNTLIDGSWMGRGLYPIALAAVAAVALWPPARRNPVAVSLVLWALGYSAFLAYHNNLQPRYYLVVAVPLTMLVPLVLELLWVRSRSLAVHGPVFALIGALAVVVFLDARQTLHYVRTPEYTFLSAAKQIERIINANRSHHRLVLSISGSDLSLMTGLPSICDDFGTLELEDRVNQYQPGWYASWNQVDDDKMDALAPQYHLERVAAFPALDDPDRNLLILYRLDPSKGYRPPHRQRRRPLPKSLISRFGQQPSAQQLEH